MDKITIDELYEIAGNSSITNVHVVDCRGSLEDLTDWVDEIHGASEGFKKIAKKFKAKLEQVIITD